MIELLRFQRNQHQKEQWMEILMGRRPLNRHIKLPRVFAMRIGMLFFRVYFIYRRKIIIDEFLARVQHTAWVDGWLGFQMPIIDENFIYLTNKNATLLFAWCRSIRLPTIYIFCQL